MKILKYFLVMLFISSVGYSQNVNKVETKIELNFDVLNSNLLNDEERDKIFIKLRTELIRMEY